MDISFSLSYYKKKEVQEAILREAENKECSVMYLTGAFGKRPDVLLYENDILEHAKRKASSFHCSEELWANPLNLKTNMKKNELNDLRIGWDLILDIDCPDWELSKLTTHLFIQALKDNGIQTIFCKFSGNKGFHIAIPFESFPQRIYFSKDNFIEFKDFFPDGAKKIALYLLSYITKNYAEVTKDGIRFLNKYDFGFSNLNQIAKKNSNSIIAHSCKNCNHVLENLPKKIKSNYVCSNCGHTDKISISDNILKCSSCSFPVTIKLTEFNCPKCNSNIGFTKIFNFFSVVDVDTILISSRHLYRMPYSLHEKSNLVSIPIEIDEVLGFDKNLAKIENINFKKLFIDRTKVQPGEASTLIRNVMEEFKESEFKEDVVKEIVIPENAIPEKYFPPCVKNILKGLVDGKKRSLFILINFLRTIGWNYENIEKFIFDWNKNNPEPLREQYIKGQLHQIKKGAKPVLPPNCSNKDYYDSFTICAPDEFCKFIKNPSHYSKMKFENRKKTNKKNVDCEKLQKDKKIVVVDGTDDIIGAKKQCELSEKDSLRYISLIIKNSAEGILLLFDKNLNKWDFPINNSLLEKETEEKYVKKLAKQNISLITFVTRKDKIEKIGNNYHHFFKTLVDRHVNLFKLNEFQFSNIKWFSDSELRRKIKENSQEFSDIVFYSIKHKII